MKIFKKKYLSIFLISLLTLIIVIGFYFVIDRMRRESERKNPRNWIKVSVVDTINKLPPGLIIDIENNGPRTVGRSHFRLVFEVKGISLCRVDTDIGNFEPGIKKRILLQCSGWNSKVYSFSYPIEVDYILQVFPEWGDPVEPLEGRFRLR